MTIIGFVEEFSDFLEPIILSRDPLFLSFDICVDDHNNTAACHFFDLLELISLTQRVSESTHELGHVLDLNNFIRGQHMPDILFPDNLTLLFKLKANRPPFKLTMFHLGSCDHLVWAHFLR